MEKNSRHKKLDTLSSSQTTHPQEKPTNQTGLRAFLKAPEKLGAPLLLINSRNADFAKQYVRENSIKSQIVLGDSDLISNKTVNYIVK